MARTVSTTTLGTSPSGTDTRFSSRSTPMVEPSASPPVSTAATPGAASTSVVAVSAPASSSTTRYRTSLAIAAPPYRRTPAPPPDPVVAGQDGAVPLPQVPRIDRLLLAELVLPSWHPRAADGRGLVLGYVV